MDAKTALVVDDSKSARFALRKFLEAHSYKVETAESAEEALRLLAQARPDVVFLDHQMPGADGFDVLRRIKGSAHTVTIPVVICSSNEGDEFARQARSRGAADVLEKPPRPDRIARVLDNLQKQAAAFKPPAEGVPRPAAAKVAPIREPAALIERAVLQAVRGAAPPADPVPDAAAGLRELMEARLRKVTQDLYAELAGLKARVAHLDGAAAGRTSDPALATELAQLRRQLDELQRRCEGSLKVLEKQMQDLGAAVRQVAADEAHAVAERALLDAARRISSQFAEGILQAAAAGRR